MTIHILKIEVLLHFGCQFKHRLLLLSSSRAPTNTYAFGPSEHYPCDLMYSSWVSINAPLVRTGSPSGRCPTHPWSFRAPAHTPFALLGDALRVLMQYSWAPTNTPLNHPGAAPCALGPSKTPPDAKGRTRHPRDAVATHLRRRSPRQMPL